MSKKRLTKERDQAIAMAEAASKFAAEDQRELDRLNRRVTELLEEKNRYQQDALAAKSELARLTHMAKVGIKIDEAVPEKIAKALAMADGHAWDSISDETRKHYMLTVKSTFAIIFSVFVDALFFEAGGV